jgi:hypothetical protein
MDVEQRKRVIQGIVSINLSIFLACSVFFTERGSFSWDTGNHIDYFFSMLSARTGWDSCFMILLCTCILSFGIYRICVKPLPGAERKSAEV